MAKYTASKADRKYKRAPQERLDALTEGGVVSRLEPGQLRSDFADPAGSETSEEVKARAALVARARKSRKALARRVRKVLAPKAEALNQRSESVPDPVQAAVEQQTPDELQETPQEADTSGQPAGQRGHGDATGRGNTCSA